MDTSSLITYLLKCNVYPRYTSRLEPENYCIRKLLYVNYIFWKDIKYGSCQHLFLITGSRDVNFFTGLYILVYTMVKGVCSRFSCFDNVT